MAKTAPISQNTRSFLNANDACYPTLPNRPLLMSRRAGHPTHQEMQARTRNEANQRILTHSLRLPRLRHLSLPSPLRSLHATLSVQHKVPPPERARIVANKLLMMRIVVLRASPERQEMVQRPREFVAGMRINGLEKSEQDPDVHGQDVQVLGDSAPDDRCADCAQSKHHDFDWRGVFCGKTKWSRVLVVDFVDVLVQWTPVHCAMRPVVPCVLEDEEDRDLVCYGPDCRERHCSGETEVLRHGMEKPDLRELDCEVTEQHQFRAVPLLSRGRYLVL
jgi:hypothetical protein